MLKKIRVEDVRVGMHLHALEGAWLDHPFWKNRFTITDAQELRKLQGSKVREVWIDVVKGVDVQDVAGIPAVPAAPGDWAPEPSTQQAAPAPPDSTSMSEELRQAADVCSRGREQVVSMFREARLGRVVDAQDCLPLVEEISASVMRNPGALVSLARLKTQDDYTFMHSVAVCALMVALARGAGLDGEGCREAGLAGLVHDLGKAVMPPNVLNKPGKLTDEEFALMRTHPARGHELLQEARGASEAMLDVCLHHHERIDGSGYPHRLTGDAISQLARMGAICDVYDAVTSNRPYKAGWDPAESIARMASWQGHFDAELFKVFVRNLGIYPVGSLVRLHSGRLAVAVEHNPQALTAPVVKVFYSTKSQLPIPVQRLALATGSDRIVGRESPAHWGFTHLDELWSEGQAPRRA
jgi:HD-GYP domain-containing protein (c-di-GMP phosphodiesterase class II)